MGTRPGNTGGHARAPESGAREASASTQLPQQVELDPLTGLYNRSRFDQLLTAYLEHEWPPGLRPNALLLIDVDGFRFVNDSLGHQSGDQLLREIAARLRQEARESDLLARVGGDEFALLVHQASHEEALAVANRLIEAIKTGTGARTGVSIGIAMFDQSAKVDGRELLIAADIALFQAKEAGRGQAVVYTGKRGDSLTWIERIREAIAEQRLIVYSQPIVELQHGKVDREELLVRMLDPEGNVIPPGQFLPVAERFGAIEEIDRMVLAKAIELAGQSCSLAVNLSGPSLSSQALLLDVAEAIAGGVDSSWLNFEITETAAVANLGQAKRFARALTDLGCKLGLDDFGTGFSSFSYLKHLPVSYVKIDIEFIKDVRRGAFDQRVVAAVVDIAHTLGIETVAEGVEDAQTLAILQGLGVDYAQGFHFSHPSLVPSPRLQPIRVP
jgi:diguanylate cyclase (GGDEF)-like protein